MANPTRKDAETTAKKKRTSTRKTKKETTVKQPPNSTDTTPKGTTSTDTNPKNTTGKTRQTKKSTGSPGGVTPTGGKSTNSGNLTHGINVLDVNSLVSGDSYSVLSGVPEMSKKDSLKLQTQLARQQNALDVRYERAKTLRKGIKVATEEQNAVTDFVNFQSAVVGTETAVFNYQSAVVDKDIASSKLEENQEKLIQQQNSTATTIAMTPLLQEENNLNLTKQQLKNDKLRLDIEQTRNDLALKQNELDAMVIDI